MNKWMKKRIKHSLLGYLLISPLLIGCLLFYIIPFGMVIWYSFRKSASRNSAFVKFDNYRNLLKNEMFLTACWNTCRFLLVGIPLILVLAYLIALLLRKQTEHYQLLKSVLLFPYIMPVVGTVLLTELLFAENSFMIPIRNLLESEWVFGAVILLYLWKNTGYSVILLLAGLMMIPKEQYASASLDGAGALQKFIYITTPQMHNTVFFTLLFSLINAFKCFREIFLIAGKHPDKKVYMLQHFINNSFENLNYPKLSAASVLLFLAVTVLIGTAYYWVRRKGNDEK